MRSPNRAAIACGRLLTTRDVYKRQGLDRLDIRSPRDIPGGILREIGEMRINLMRHMIMGDLGL